MLMHCSAQIALLKCASSSLSTTIFAMTFLCAVFEVFSDSVEPDQWLQNAASDLGLHCLPYVIYGTMQINELTGRNMEYLNCQWQFPNVQFSFDTRIG